MIMVPKITLVIPTYNRADLMPEALKSCLDQSEPIDEVIVIDNHSDDDTLKIAKDYASRAKNIKVYQNPKNVGMVNNWNVGIKKAKNNFVSLLHSDDLLPKNWCKNIKEAIRFYQDNQVMLYFGQAHCFKKEDGGLKIVSKLKPFSKNLVFKKQESINNLWKSFYYNPGCSSALIYQRRVFDEIGFFDPSQGPEADQGFHLRLLKKYSSIYIDRCLVYYRRHEFQAFDAKKEKENINRSIDRIKNSILIQKSAIKDKKILSYGYCGVVSYIIKFLLGFKVREAIILMRIPGIINFTTLINLPRFYYSFFSRRYLNK
jgi:glycosyltransferase involved in cell wall biosynthesis